MPIKPGKYVHFKGKEYEVIGTATHSETSEEMVVYRALYGEGDFWVRPAEMWNDVIDHEGRRVNRFTYIDDFLPEVEPRKRAYPQEVCNYGSTGCRQNEGDGINDGLSDGINDGTNDGLSESTKNGS